MWEMGKIKGVTRRGEGSEHKSNLRDWGRINSKDVWKSYKEYFLNLAFNVHPHRPRPFNKRQNNA